METKICSKCHQEKPIAEFHKNGFNSKGEQEVHIFVVTNEHPMDIYEARDLCLKHGLDSAMAFDGGSSTSLNYKKINVVSTQNSGDTGRALKSFMIIKK